MSFGNISKNTTQTGTVNGKKVTFITGRVYPSTAVEGILSKKDRERPRISPQEMTDICNKFKTLKKNQKPRLRFEHSTCPRKELGVIHNLWQHEDGWLYMSAGIYDKHKEVMGQLLENGIFKKGISLSFYVNGQYKNLIEISLTSNPDFEGAEVEYYHSEINSGNILVWPLSIGTLFPPQYFEHMAQQQQQQPQSSSGSSGPNELDGSYTQLPSGVMVVKDPTKVQAVQQMAISKGIDPAMVVYQDVSGLEGMNEEQRNALFAAMLSENQKLAEQTQRQFAAQQQQAIQSTFNEIRPVVEFATGILPEADRDVVGQQLAVGMATNPQMRAMGDLLEARMHEFNRLREENEMLKKQQSSSFQSSTQISPVPLPSMQSNLQSSMFGGSPMTTGYQQPAVFSHSAGTPSTSSSLFFPQPMTSFGGVPFPTTTNGMTMSDMWNQMNSAFRSVQQQQQQASQTPSSSSSSQVPQIHQHSADSRSTAKRSLRDAYDYEGFQLFPQKAGDVASQQSASPEILIFAHSASSPAVDPKRRRVLPGSPIDEAPPGGFLSKLTKNSSDEDVMRANLSAIITGERFIGKVSRDFLTENLFSKNPKVFTQAAFGFLKDPIIDNQHAGLTGFKDHTTDSVMDRVRSRIRARGLEDKYFVSTEEFDSRSNQYFNTG